MFTIIFKLYSLVTNPYQVPEIVQVLDQTKESGYTKEELGNISQLLESYSNKKTLY